MLTIQYTIYSQDKRLHDGFNSHFHLSVIIRHSEKTTVTTDKDVTVDGENLFTVCTSYHMSYRYLYDPTP